MTDKSNPIPFALTFVNALVPGQFNQARSMLNANCEYIYNGKKLSGDDIVNAFIENHEKAKAELDQIEYQPAAFDSRTENRITVKVSDRIVKGMRTHTYSDRLAITVEMHAGDWRVVRIEHLPISAERLKLKAFVTGLRTERLLLRSWQQGDQEALVKYANNKKIAMNLRDRFPHPYTLKDADQWISFVENQSPVCSFAIEYEGHAIGSVGLMLGADVFRRTAELGYWIAEPYWGKGFATEATKATVEYGFEAFDLVRIHGGVFDWNPASCKVLEKAGFGFEACMKKAVTKEGQILDQLNYVIIR